jgi:DNA-3-methyladenine glycosylase II
MHTFILTARGPFSLAASTKFLEGFTPAAYTGAAGQPLELAFPAEGSWQTAGVRVREHPNGVEGELVSPQARETGGLVAVRAQVARILSLDVDGSGFPAVGERDPVVAGLQARYPGLRPVGFWSPYEAACWAIIGHRIRIRQAAAIKARITGQFGEPVSFGTHVMHAFPAPQRLAELDAFPGLSGRKPEWLRAAAAAALDGALDAARLRALPRGQALAELKQLPGIGDFSAELVLLRGAGDPDHFPRHDPRLARAVALAYHLPEPAGCEQLLRLSENWRPYRTWAALLLRAFLEDQTGEIAGPPARVAQEVFMPPPGGRDRPGPGFGGDSRHLPFR